MKTIPKRSLKAVLFENTDQWMALSGVVGVYEGEKNGKACIKIMVVKKTKSLQSILPTAVDGFQVFIEETGVIRSL